MQVLKPRSMSAAARRWAGARSTAPSSFTALIFSSLVFAVVVAAGAPPAEAQPIACGIGPTDWCPAPAGDPCGRHRTREACRADPACVGLRYRGESVVACRWDARGFATNCPTVGCVSAKTAAPATPARP